MRNIWEKSQHFLGSEYGILGGAMTWVSNYQLVSAISNAGGFGVLACGAMSVDALAQEIQQTYQHTKKPFGVNLIVMHPDISALTDVCIQQKIRHVFFGGGIPRQQEINVLKQADVKVVGFAPSLVIAKKLIRMGVDALVIEGHEAGGHVGAVSTSVLVQEVLLPLKDEIPIFIAGGISCGQMIATYMSLGAAGCQLGTRFVCATESPAHENFKQVFVRAHARDAILSVQIDPRFQVIPVRAIANDGTNRFMEMQRQVIHRFNAGEISKSEAQLEIEHFWAGALRRAVVDGDVKNGSLMAGQSVGLVKSIQPCDEIIQTLRHEMQYNDVA